MCFHSARDQQRDLGTGSMAFISVCSCCDLVKPPLHPYPSISTCNVPVRTYAVAPRYCLTNLPVIITLIYVVWLQILFYSELQLSTSLRVESPKQCYCPSRQRTWLGPYCAFPVWLAGLWCTFPSLQWPCCRVSYPSGCSPKAPCQQGWCWPRASEVVSQA